MMFQHIVVPLDTSAGAEHAIPVAARLVRASGGTIVLVCVLFSSMSPAEMEATSVLARQPSLRESYLTEAERYLARVRNRFAHELSGISVEQTVVSGSASSAVLAMACQKPTDLIVLSSHRAQGLFHWTLSGIIHEALSHCPAPLLFFNEAEKIIPASDQEWPLRVLLPLNGSVLSEAVIRPTLDLVATVGDPKRSRIHLLQVVDLPSAREGKEQEAQQVEEERLLASQEAEASLQKLAHRLRNHPSCPVITWEIRINTDVAGTIARIAEASEGDQRERGYDLVALTTHGRHALEHLMLGSVSEQMLGATQRPLLLVRPPQRMGSISHQNMGIAPADR